MNDRELHKVLLDGGLITQQIGDCCYDTSLIRNTFPPFLKTLGFQTGAEIGVNRGGYSNIFAQHLTGTFYAIDPWVCFSPFIFPDSCRQNTRYSSQAETDKSYRIAKGKLSKYDHVKILRQTSMQAIITIPDDSLDIIYVDGNHLYQFAWIDLWGFWSKLKRGGIMSGHDLKCKGVRKAVLEFIETFNIKFWYVMETENAPSYFWIK